MSPDLTGYRIDLTASESTSPSPMIIVSSNNQIFGAGPAPRATFGVEDDFVRNPRAIQLGLRYGF